MLSASAVLRQAQIIRNGAKPSNFCQPTSLQLVELAIIGRNKQMVRSSLPHVKGERHVKERVHAVRRQRSNLSNPSLSFVRHNRTLGHHLKLRWGNSLGNCLCAGEAAVPYSRARPVRRSYGERLKGRGRVADSDQPES